MAQRKFHEKVETWIVVTVIAVLVWLYAEATVLQQKTGESVQLIIDEPTNNYAITPNTESVSVSYRGSSGQIQQFNDITGVPMILEIDPTGITAATERTLILDEALARAGFGAIGVTDLEIDPATLNIVIQPLETLQLPVVVDAGEIPLNGEPVAEPAHIAVTAPQSVIDQLRGQSVTAKLAQANNTGDGTGRERVATNVPLIFPAELNLDSQWVKTNSDTNTVRINYTLANDTSTVVIDRVPLYINLPVDAQLRYTVRPQDKTNFLSDVELQGPADLIARIKAKDPDLTIRAEIRIADVARLEPTTIGQSEQRLSERPFIIAPANITPVQLPDVITIVARRRDATPGN